MKVLMLGWELPPHNSGGLGVACYQLCQALAHSGKNVDIDFIVPFEGDYEATFMNVMSTSKTHSSEVDIFSEAYSSRFYYNNQLDDETFTTNTFENSVYKIAETSEFDIIHAHDWLTFRAAVKAKEISNKPLIVHVHSIERDRAGGEPGNPIVREIEETTMLLADGIIAVSEKTKQDIIEEYNIPGSKISVIHNSIDHVDFRFAIDQNTYPYITMMKQQGYRVVVNVGRMTVQKGLYHLLYAAKEVIRVLPKTLFLLVGDGEQYNEIISLSAELGISQNVILTGFQRGKQWRDAYRVSDLFVMPSVSEPFGITALEATGCGLPIIISKQSGVAEVLLNCLKIDYWDVNEMANQMVNVLRSDGLSHELSNNAQNELKSVTWNKSATKVISLYQDLVGVN